MKKRIAVAAVLTLLVAVGGIIIFQTLSAAKVSAGTPVEVSAKSAEELQAKIDAVRNKDSGAEPAAESNTLELSDTELESYVLFAMREEIPAQVDLIDVQLDEGSISSETQLTFSSSNSGNPIADSLFGGTHNLFVKGALAGESGRGKFELLEVRVDGIPVPNILVETLFGQYVTPKYPDADLREPFDLPWGIESLTISGGKVTIVY
jgi:hypothetical protein